MCTSHRFITANGITYVDRCRACDEAEKAADHRRETERWAQNSAQVAAQEERRRAYERRPEMTEADWVAFLRSDDRFEGTSDEPIYQGKRAADLSTDKLIRVLKAAGCPTREIELEKPFKTGQTFQKMYKVPCWVVGEGTGTMQHYEERVPVLTLWAVVATGEIYTVTNYFEHKHFSRDQLGHFPDVWKPTAKNMAAARRYLRAPGPAKKADWRP